MTIIQKTSRAVNVLIPVLFALAMAAGAFADYASPTIDLNPATACLAPEGMADDKCREADQGCKIRYGEFSYFSGQTGDKGYICACRVGYDWNGVWTKCIPTACPDELVYYSQYRDESGWFLDGRCLTPDAACQSEYGDGAVAVETRFIATSTAGDAINRRLYEDGTILCGCAEGFEWNADQSVCRAKIVVAGVELSPAELDYIDTIAREKAAVAYWDQALMDRLSGRILLQVEDLGRAWYLDPVTRFKYYLASPAKAFQVMRERGLGAKHEFIAKYKKYPASVRGKILIDVDDLGKAYYINPVDGLGYYLGTPDVALEVMRRVGLGVRNGDLRKIPVAE